MGPQSDYCRTSVLPAPISHLPPFRDKSRHAEYRDVCAGTFAHPLPSSACLHVPTMYRRRVDNGTCCTGVNACLLCNYALMILVLSPLFYASFPLVQSTPFAKSPKVTSLLRRPHTSECPSVPYTWCTTNSASHPKKTMAI